MSESLEEFKARIAARLDTHFAMFVPVVAAINAGFSAARTSPARLHREDPRRG